MTDNMRALLVTTLLTHQILCEACRVATEQDALLAAGYALSEAAAAKEWTDDKLGDKKMLVQVLVALAGRRLRVQWRF